MEQQSEEGTYHCILLKVPPQNVASITFSLQEKSKIISCELVSIGKFNVLVRTRYRTANHPSYFARQYVARNDYHVLRENQLEAFREHLDAHQKLAEEIRDPKDYQILVDTYQRFEQLGSKFIFSPSEESTIVTIGPAEDSIKVTAQLEEKNLSVEVVILKLAGVSDMSILDDCEVCLRISNGDSTRRSVLNSGRCKFEDVQAGQYSFTPFYPFREFMIVCELRRAIHLLKKNGLSPMFIDRPITERDWRDSEYEIGKMVLQELGASE